MNTSERSQIVLSLLERREAIAENWHNAIAHTSFTSLTTAEVRRRLDELTGQAIALLFSEPFERDKARQIGSSVASMHYLSSGALEKTQEVLSVQLVEGLSADDVTAVQPRLIALLREVAVGFFDGARDTILLEQEQIKAALLSERRKIEEALRESEASLAEAQRIAHVGYWQYDWTKHRLRWSDEILRIFGVTKEEFGGTFADYFMRVHPDDMASIERAGVEAFEGKSVPLEHRIIRPDGEVRFVQLRVQFVFDDSQVAPEDPAEMSVGQEADDSAAFLNYMSHMAVQHTGSRPVKVFGVVQDITERKLAEEELRKARDELELRVQERTAELERANEELREEVARRERSEEAQRILAESGAVLSSSLDYRTTLADVARLVVPRLGDWCAVDLLEEGGLKSVAVAHKNPEKVALAHELRRRYPPEADAVRGAPAVVRTGRSEFYPDITDEMLEAVARDEEHLRLLRELGFTSAMVVPLLARGKTLGAITLISAESGRRYGEADLELAGELARHAALAVDNALLYEEAKREIVDRRRAEEALRSSQNEMRIILQGVADGITAQDPTGAVVYANEAAAKIAGYSSAEAMVGASYSEMTRKLDILSESGQLFPLEDLPGRRALRGERSPHALLRFRDKSTGTERWAAVTAAPVFGDDGRVLLAVSILRDVTESRRTEETLREVRRAERTRIARDLHDRALQDLSYALAETQISLRLAQDPELGERLRQAVEALGRAARDLRSAVYDLRQEGGEGRWFLRSVESLVGLHRQMNLDREVRLAVGDGFPAQLSEKAARELLSVVQEALTNVRRHAEANHVLVALRAQEDDLVVEVTDDGRGFDPGVLRGVGLRSMRERTAALGGTLAVESEPGEGTRVRVLLPMSAVQNGAAGAGREQA